MWRKVEKLNESGERKIAIQIAKKAANREADSQSDRRRMGGRGRGWEAVEDA